MYRIVYLLHYEYIITKYLNILTTITFQLLLPFTPKKKDKF